jgi:hypothetical protein
MEKFSSAEKGEDIATNAQEHTDEHDVAAQVATRAHLQATTTQ